MNVMGSNEGYVLLDPTLGDRSEANMFFKMQMISEIKLIDGKIW